jgi:hypothetical protein
MTLSIGQKITLVRISEAMAMTSRYELEVRSPIDPPQKVGYEGRNQRLAIARQRGKRKDFFLDVPADAILLDGWDVPFKADTECNGVMSGNACYNLVGDPDAIRDCLERRALVPLTDDAKAKVVVSRERRTRCDDDGLILLYPDVETHHAVINRLKAERA